MNNSNLVALSTCTINDHTITLNQIETPLETFFLVHHSKDVGGTLITVHQTFFEECEADKARKKYNASVKSVLLEDE